MSLSTIARTAIDTVVTGTVVATQADGIDLQEPVNVVIEQMAQGNIKAPLIALASSVLVQFALKAIPRFFDRIFGKKRKSNNGEQAS